MTHEQKVKLARKMRTPQEAYERVSIWNSKAWEARRVAIAARIGRTIAQRTIVKQTPQTRESGRGFFSRSFSKVKELFANNRQRPYFNRV